MPVTAPGGNITYIEPQPIRIEDGIGAVDANNIKALGKNYRQFIATKLDVIRRRVRATTEALAAQSLTGKIQYPLLLENGQYTLYEVDYTRGGANPTLSYSPAVMWNGTGATVGKVLDDFIAIEEKFQEKGYGGNIRLWAGRSAFSALRELVMGSRAEKKIEARIADKNINIAGYVVELMNATYKNPQSGAMVKVVGDNDLLAWDESAPFTLFYLAIDHFKAGLNATPLFLYSYQPERGDSIRILAESKPLPVPVVKAVCRATVVS